MKTIYSYISGLIIVLSISACSDLLDTKPITTSIKKASPTATIASIRSLRDGLYKKIADDQEYNILDRIVNGDAVSDNCYAGGDNSANFALDEFTYHSLNSNLNRDWNGAYGLIAKANEVILQIRTSYDSIVVKSSSDKAVLDKMLAEARAYRAFFYFDLVQLFGGVPLIVFSPTTEDASTIFKSLAQPRASEEEVYAFIVKELEEALMTIAPTSTTDKQIITKGVVQAMLAKVYAQQKQWDKVVTYADLVIPQYSLLTNYDDLFDPATNNSSESIWEIYYGASYNGQSRSSWVVGIHVGTDWKKFNLPSNDLVSAFDSENDTIRKKSSIVIQAGSSGWVDKYWDISVLPRIAKMRGGTLSEVSKWGYGGKSSWYMIRLADIILLKAEALNQKGDLSGATTLLNQIRSRAKLASKIPKDKAEMATAIDKERRLELAFEGHRWNDLRREGRVLDVMNAVKDGKNQSLGYNVKSYQLVMPIPREQINRNSNLKQNSGYN